MALQRTGLMLLSLLALLTAASAVDARVHQRTPVRVTSSAPAVAVAVAAAAAAPPSAVLLQDLTSASGVTWTLSGSDQQGAPLSVPGKVPGNVYPDLVAAGVLAGDPLFRYNEEKFQWVASLDWTYTATFDLADGAAALQFDTVQLEADGIDTVASVTLNGQLVGQTEDMHLQFVADVKPLLQAHSNTLVVRISSPLVAGAARQNAYPYDVPRTDQLGSLPTGNFLRKAASDYGWDWGPAFAGSGIWLPLRLVAFQQARIVEMQVHQVHAAAIDNAHRKALGGLQQGDVALNVQTFIRLGSKQNVAGNLCVSLQPQAPPQLQREWEAAAATPLQNCTSVSLAGPSAAPDLLGQVSVSVWLTVPAASAPLWWPAGYGAQALQQVTATFDAQDGSGSASTFTRTIGLKRVELVRETGPAGQNGTSFYFKVNAVPIFIKGANMIPFSSFHGTDTDANVTSVLRALLDAGGNTLRVWGGGNYAQNKLYEFASQHGLLVWQEFSFACALYPRDDAFLSLVRREVAYQTRRLGSHAAMLVFGGNNENEVALTWYAPSIENRDLYLVDYVKLYLDTVRDQVIRELAGVGRDSLPFVSSSPSRGPLSEDPYTQMWGAAQSVDYGDMHYYNYAADCADVSLLPRPRFVSEFGFQSLPSLHTLAPILDESQGDYSWNSSVMNYRQRHADGNEEMLAQMALHFHTPDASSAAKNFTDWLYLTQAVQALCYSTAINHWRRIKQETPGRTQGVIYWQLNDLWQGPTWSSLEYGGRWKQLHNVLQRSFAPLAATGFVDNSTGTPTVQAYVTSDINAAVEGELSISLVSWSGDVKKIAAQIRVQLQPLQSLRVYSTPLSEVFSVTGCQQLANCFLSLQFSGSSAATEQLPAQETLLSPRAEIFPVPLRLAPLQMPKLALTDFAPAQILALEADDVRSSSEDAGPLLLSASFLLSTDVGAAVVVLDTPLAGHFSANSFTLRAGESVNVSFVAQSEPLAPFTLQQLRSSLTVRSLRDSYSDGTAARMEALLAQTNGQQEEQLASKAKKHAGAMLQHRSAEKLERVQSD